MRQIDKFEEDHNVEDKEIKMKWHRHFGPEEPEGTRNECYMTPSRSYQSRLKIQYKILSTLKQPKSNHSNN